MRPFELTAPTTVEDALATSGTFLAGGTTLVDLMKLDVLTPQHVLDINQVRCAASTPATACASARWSG